MTNRSSGQGDIVINWDKVRYKEKGDSDKEGEGNYLGEGENENDNKKEKLEQYEIRDRFDTRESYNYNLSFLHLQVLISK